MTNISSIAPKTVNFHTIEVDGARINFPFEPYDLQISYMRKVLECVREGKNGLLESPTGTGKTLSLLCSSLSWLEDAKAKKQLARVQAAAVLDQPSDVSGMLTNRHKIIYSSRTHSQLSQAMSELAGTSYRYMRVAILGSRDQLCVNAAVMEATSGREKINMCQARVKAKTCTYHQNVEKHKERPEFREGKLMDIEDLHKLGKKHNFCPYYMSKELYQTADVIFLPYNYLLDAKTRKTLDLDLSNSVIIFDEAHNIQKLCEEAASVSVNLSDIALAIQDIDWISEDVQDKPKVQGFEERDDLRGAAIDINESEMLAVKGFLLEIEAKLIALMKDTKQITKTGIFIPEIFFQFQYANVQHTMDLMMNYSTSKNEGAISTRGRGLSKISDLVTTAFNSSVTQEDLEKLYKVVLIKEEKSEGGKGFLKTKSETIVLNLWCFSPGFTMKNLSKLGARSIILTSGTLSPLSAFQQEIGIPFPVQLENKHIITASQVWCGCVTNGPDGTLLNSSFKCRSDPKYLLSLGHSIINIIRVVPNGVLIFFPSYSLMNSSREFWQASGLWTKIEAIKPIFLEPQRKDALPTIMKEYYAAAKDKRGACFLAVCRGKVAEGLDFADDNGRACIITGLPYPPLKDARVELKRQFLDDELKKKGKSSTECMTGTKWYGLEAFRATNQAIGRVIRHSRDHGAIVFLDNRFCDGQAKQSLSSWLQPFFQKHSQLGSAIKGLANFFKTDSLIGKQRDVMIAEQTALINSKNQNKRKRVDVRLEESEGLETEKFDLTQLYTGSGSTHNTENKEPSNIYEEAYTGITFNKISQETFTDFRKPIAPVRPAQVRKKLKIVRGPSKPSGCVSPQATTSPKSSAANSKTGHSKNLSTSGHGGRSMKIVSPIGAKTNQTQAIPSFQLNEDGKVTQDTARSYVALLKNTVTASEFILFKGAMKAYKQTGNLKGVTSTLDTILLKYLEARPELLIGFKVFIKKTQVKEFELFCEQAKMSAKDIVQVKPMIK